MHFGPILSRQRSVKQVTGQPPALRAESTVHSPQSGVQGFNHREHKEHRGEIKVMRNPPSSDYGATRRTHRGEDFNREVFAHGHYTKYAKARAFNRRDRGFNNEECRKAGLSLKRAQRGVETLKG